MSKKKKTHVTEGESPPLSLPRWFSRIPHPILALFGYLPFWTFYFRAILWKQAFLWEDFLYQNYVYRFFAATHLKEGILPFWNPYIWSGLPFVADVQAAVFYPLNLVLTLFVKNGWLAYHTVEVQALLHVLLAGWFMYLALRWMGFSGIPAFLGGLTFMFSARIILEITHLNTLHVVTYIPLVLGLLWKAWDTRKIRWAILGGLVQGIGALGGYPQTQVWLFFALLLLSFVWWGTRDRSFRPFGYLIVLEIFAVGVPLIQYVPTVLAFLESARAHYTKAELLAISVDPGRLITLLVPRFFGSVDGGIATTYWGHGPTYFYWETGGYVGLLPILLLPLVRRSRNQPIKWGALLLMLFGILMALGKYSPLYQLLFYVFPPFHQMRSPARFMLLYVLGGTFALTLGIQMLSQQTRSLSRGIRRELLTWAGFLLFLILLALIGFSIPSVVRSFVTSESIRAMILILVFTGLLFGITPKNRPQVLTILTLGIFFDLYAFGGAFNNGKISPARFFAKTPQLQNIQKLQQEELFRTNIRQKSLILYPRNIGSIYRIFTTDGYNPLVLNRYNIFKQSKVLSREKRFDMLNVRFETRRQGQGAVLVERTHYLPRAYLVWRYQVIQDSTQVIRTLASPEFDPFRMVVLERQPTLPIPDPPPVDSIVPAKIVSYTPNRIVLKVSAPDNAILVLSENYYPLWEATVDGEKVPVIPANYTLRAITVPKGNHTVVFEYNRKLFNLGLGLTAIFLIGGVFLVWVLR